MSTIMKHSLAAYLLTLTTITLQATAAVVDYSSGKPITSSGYYQYHTEWVTTTCYETMTKTRDCSYDGGDFAGNYETVSPQVYPGPDYKDYKTVYETVYETPNPYPYKTSEPFPYETICYPETVYSTVYPDSSGIVYHTFTASGTDETLTGSPVYHTMDSTIIETVTATPSGGSVSGCSTGPWLANPGFEDPAWPGVWFPSGSGTVERINRSGDTPDGSDWVLELTAGGSTGDVPQLSQAITIPLSSQFNFSFSTRRVANAGGGNIIISISLGSYLTQDILVTSSPQNMDWNTLSVQLPLDGLPECVSVVFNIKITTSIEISESSMGVQIDNLIMSFS